MRQCEKIWCGHKWCHNMAHTSCLLDEQGYMHACARPRAKAYARAGARTHKCVIFVAFTLQQ